MPRSTTSITAAELAEAIRELRTQQTHLQDQLRDDLTRAVEEMQQYSQSIGQASQPPDSQASVTSTSSHSGPSVPPTQGVHPHAEILWNFRHVYSRLSGAAELGRHPASLGYPSNHSVWPRHPLKSDGTPGERHTRFDYSEPWQHPNNQEAARQVHDHMLANREACGVPATMSRERLSAITAVTFRGYRRAHKDGEGAIAERKNKSKASSRQTRKSLSRKVAFGLTNHVYMADGRKIRLDIHTGRRGAKTKSSVTFAPPKGVRADLEFAFQPAATSPELDKWQPFEGEGEGRWARERVALPWRAPALIKMAEDADKKRKTRTNVPVLPPTTTVNIPAGWTLPSSIRRWMVSEAWYDAHPETCVDVSDNAGPFVGAFSQLTLATGPKSWGPSVLPDESATTSSSTSASASQVGSVAT
ncbi:hypothetical protein OC835_004276 [Tilletia horrida]|nr:hypothetical protein OC835_004276 [Tilletia horrida]